MDEEIGNKGFLGEGERRKECIQTSLVHTRDTLNEKMRKGGLIRAMSVYKCIEDN